jgi:hypothetical protein
MTFAYWGRQGQRKIALDHLFTKRQFRRLK